MKPTAKTIGILQASRMFSTERKVVKWLEKVRWGGKPVCAHCDDTWNNQPSPSKPFTYWCRSCHKDFTVKTHTILHASKLPTSKWLIAIYCMLTARKGISSLQLSKELGITQKSAWFMEQRIRNACRFGSFLLTDIVEVDETYIGGKEGNKHAHKKLHAGRGAVGKSAVVGLHERGGRVKAQHVQSADKDTLQGIIEESVRKDSTVYSDDHRSYIGLGTRAQVHHGVVKHSVAEYVDGMAHTNGIESMWAVLKRGYHGTHHHMSAKHLQRYVNGFAFRMNEGNCQRDTLDSMESLCQAMTGRHMTYGELIQ